MRKHVLQRSFAGIAMIEILVTVVVLSIGVLGAAGMQVATVKQTNNSGLRTQALILAKDMVRRVRTNRNAVLDSDDVTAGSYEKGPGSAFPTSALTSCLSGGSCTPEQIAQADLVVWSRMLQNSLPVDDDLMRSRVFICQDSDPGDNNDCPAGDNGSVLLIQVAWNESSITDNNSVQTLRLGFEP